MPIRQVIQPLASIAVIFTIIHKGSLPLSHIVPHLALVVASSAKNVSPVSVGEPMGKGTVIVRPIFEEEFSYAMGLIILPLALVDCISCLD